MNTTEYLLTLIQEECAELSQRAAKAQRFGLYEVQKGQEKNNLQRIIYEYRDLLTVVKLFLTDQGIKSEALLELEENKLNKLRKYSKLSKDLGCLEQIPSQLK